MLIVVRHGRTRANAAGELLGRRDPPLDSLGRTQAVAVAASLPDGIRVISSPLTRCMETASFVSDEVETDARLLEFDYGTLEGTPVADVPSSTWAEWRKRSDWAPEGGESHDELADRVWSLLDELAPDGANEDIALVTHVSPIKAAVAWSLGVSIDISWRCFVSQASISRIATARATPSLTSFNEVGHLDGID